MAFTVEHDKFLLEAYFRSGERDENGVWQYSIHSCFNQLLAEFPNEQFVYGNIFPQYVRRLVARFRQSGSVSKRKSTGRHTVLTEEVVGDIQQRLQASPTKPLRHLSAQTGKGYLANK